MFQDELLSVGGILTAIFLSERALKLGTLIARDRSITNHSTVCGAKTANIATGEEDSILRCKIERSCHRPKRPLSFFLDKNGAGIWKMLTVGHLEEQGSIYLLKEIQKEKEEHENRTKLL